MEHRQAQREPAEIMVLLSTADGVTRKGHIKNLSSLGAGVVMTNGSLARGTMVELRLSPSGAKQRIQRMRTRGYVVRARGSEFGLLWVTEDGSSSFFNDENQQADSKQDNKAVSA